MTGRVEFDPRAGCGIIRGRDGKEYRVYAADIRDPIRVGDRVAFIPKGSRAAKVRLLTIEGARRR